MAKHKPAREYEDRHKRNALFVAIFMLVLLLIILFVVPAFIPTIG